MSKLVIHREFYKKADEYGDGPSFEQQFGILANAVVTSARDWTSPSWHSSSLTRRTTTPKRAGCACTSWEATSYSSLCSMHRGM